MSTRKTKFLLVSAVVLLLAAPAGVFAYSRIQDARLAAKQEQAEKARSLVEVEIAAKWDDAMNRLAAKIDSEDGSVFDRPTTYLGDVRYAELVSLSNQRLSLLGEEISIVDARSKLALATVEEDSAQAIKSELRRATDEHAYWLAAQYLQEVAFARGGKSEIYTDEYSRQNAWFYRYRDGSRCLASIGGSASEDYLTGANYREKVDSLCKWNVSVEEYAALSR